MVYESHGVTVTCVTRCQNTTASIGNDGEWIIPNGSRKLSSQNQERCSRALDPCGTVVNDPTTSEVVNACDAGRRRVDLQIRL